jgi:hypothetical protein
VVQEIETPMQYFKSLDEIAPRMSITTTRRGAHHPDDEQFRLDMQRLDECLAFIEAHPHYAEHAVYVHRFKQVQTQACEIIKLWVNESVLKTTTSVLASKAATPGGGALLDDPHLYHRFAELGKRLRPAVEELEKRPGLGLRALRECLTCYCASRQRLLSGAIAASEELKAEDNLVLGIIRGSAFLTGLCRAEYKLLSGFFSLRAYRQMQQQQQQHQGDVVVDDDDEGRGRSGAENGSGDAYNEVMASLFMGFYDKIRPAILRCNDLEALCDALSALEGSVHDLARMDPDAGEPLADVLSIIASDAQERMVFCAVRVIRDEVQGYMPNVRGVVALRCTNLSTTHRPRTWITPTNSSPPNLGTRL